MRCLMCFSSDGKLQRFQRDVDKDIFEKITFVFPEHFIPESKGPVFICATCLQEVSFRHTNKMAGLRNDCHSKHFNTTIKEENNFEFNEYKIDISSDELPTKHEHLVEIKVEPNQEDLFLSEEIDPTLVKKEEKINDDNSQQLENDVLNLNDLKVDESSRSIKVSSQNKKNLGSYEFVDINKFTEKDSNLTSNSRYNNEPNTQRGSHEKLFKCGVCAESFLTRVDLRIHLRTHNEEMREPNTKHQEKMIKCNECSRSFTTPTILEIHKRIHTEDRPHKCPICQKGFVRRYNLNVHLLTHTDEKLYECDVCHKSYKQKRDLVTHSRTQHNIEPQKSQKNSLKCDECDKLFTRQKVLDIHMRTHTGERPFKCSICQNTFSQAITLKKHELIHTGEKPHECDVCHKMFIRKDNLIVHKRSHSSMRPYQCGTCNRAFMQASHLEVHMRTHTGEKPYECLLCEFKCSQVSTLKRHIGRHGRKRYMCQYCDKSYTAKSDYLMHKYKYHKIVESD